jgi:hypothetical protein
MFFVLEPPPINEKLNSKNRQINAKISMKNIDFRRKMHEN